MDKDKKPTHRIEKVNALIQRIVGEIIHEYASNFSGLTTVSKVETSRDMKWAKIWISIVAGEDAKIMDNLNKNLYDIQGELNRAMATKVVPRLQLFLDTTPRYAQHIDELVKKIHEEDKNEPRV